MSTIDTSTWNPDADLNTAIEGIPLNSDASITQTWQALRILMAAVKGDGDAIKGLLADAVDGVLQTKIYPVGSTFFSLTDSRNPNAILGFGTWTAIEGKFLLGASSSYAADSTGGEATHTLTASELPDPAQCLALQYAWNNSADGTGSWRIIVGNHSATMWSGAGRIKSTSAAIGQPHNNMPPYLAGYLWRRTA